MKAGRRRRRSWFVALGALALALTGCRGPELLQPNLTGRDRHLAALQEELWRGEVGQLSQSPEKTENSPIQTVAYREAAKSSPVRRLRVDPVGDAHLTPGRGVQLRIQPHDADGKPRQVTANLRVGLVELGADGGKLIGSWDFSAEQLVGCWDVQWSGGGYTVILPPQKSVSGLPVRVVARMTLADHTRLEAIHDLPVRARDAVPVAERGVDEGVRTASSWEPPPLRQAFRLMQPVPLEENEHE